MKRVKKMTMVMLAIILFAVTALPGKLRIAEAAETPESIVAAALKNLKSYETISYSSKTTRTIDGYKDIRTAMVVSDLKLEHGFCITGTGVSGCWEEYVSGKKIFRRSYTDKAWTKYVDKSYNSSDFKYFTSKKALAYLCANLKNVKISKSTSTSYTITATPDIKGTYLKSVTFVIDKKRQLFTSVKLSYKTYKGTYQDSSETYSVKNQVVTWSDICYGYTALKLPNGLK